MTGTGFQTLSQINRIGEAFKGGYYTTGMLTQSSRITVGELSWKDKCEYYDRQVSRHPLVKASFCTLAGQLMAQGIHLEPEVDNEGEPYPRSLDAMELCNELNADIGLDSMLNFSTYLLGPHGSIFWEKDADGDGQARIIPGQENIEPSKHDGHGTVTLWRQTDGYRTVTEWTEDEIIHIPWNPTSKSWPYGTSMLDGLEVQLENLANVETYIQQHMKNVAFPRDLLQIGDGNFMPNTSEISTIKNDVKNWNPGEIHVTSYPIKRETTGVGDREVADLDKVLTFMKNQIVDGLMTPPVSYQYSSTYASSKEMMIQQRANLIIPLQRLFKRKIETELYKPYLESRGFSVKVCPHVTFESAEAFKPDVADYYSKLVAGKIIPPRFAAKKLGIPLEEFDAWVKEEEEKQQKMFDQKMEQSKLNADKANAEQATGDVPERAKQAEPQKT